MEPLISKTQACPCCGETTNVEGNHVEIDGETSWQRVTCLSCGCEYIETYGYTQTEVYDEESIKQILDKKKNKIAVSMQVTARFHAQVTLPCDFDGTFTDDVKADLKQQAYEAFDSCDIGDLHDADAVCISIIDKDENRIPFD